MQKCVCACLCVFRWGGSYHTHPILHRLWGFSAALRCSDVNSHARFSRRGAHVGQPSEVSLKSKLHFDANWELCPFLALSIFHCGECRTVLCHPGMEINWISARWRQRNRCVKSDDEMGNVLVAVHGAISVFVRKSVIVAEWSQLFTVTTGWAINAAKDDMFAFTRVNIVLELLISCKLLLLSLCHIYIKKTTLHHWYVVCLSIYCAE